MKMLHACRATQFYTFFGTYAEIIGGFHFVLFDPRRGQRRNKLRVRRVTPSLLPIFYHCTAKNKDIILEFCMLIVCMSHIRNIPDKWIYSTFNILEQGRKSL